MGTVKKRFLKSAIQIFTNEEETQELFIQINSGAPNCNTKIRYINSYKVPKHNGILSGVLKSEWEKIMF